MAPLVVVAIITALATVIGAVVAGIFGLLQATAAKKYAAETHSIVKGNGHGTVTDMVDLIRQTQSDTLVLLGALSGRFETHLSDTRVHDGLRIADRAEDRAHLDHIESRLTATPMPAVVPATEVAAQQN